MMLLDRKRHRVLSVLLIALLMRVAIPAGYMPAAAGSGLLFELCPEGMPALVMQALSPQHHHHHEPSDETQGSFDAEQCPVGHMLASAIAGDAAEVPDLEAPALAFDVQIILSHTCITRAVYLSRAPPPEEWS